MVVINLQIAFASDFEIEQPVAREQFKHVVEKRDARVDGVFTLAVEVERDANVSLFGCAFDFSLTSRNRLPVSSCQSLYQSERITAGRYNFKPGSMILGRSGIIRRYAQGNGLAPVSRLRHQI